MQYVAYYRVSTAKQGQSGLGLEAQKNTVANFVKCENCIIAEFTEVESGKKNNRKELLKAIKLAKENNAKLVVARLDRLSRNVEFTSALLNTGVDFVCCDMPDANKLTIHIIAAIAQAERERISANTSAALQAKKARGAKLGVKGTENLAKSDAVQKSIAVKKENAATNENTQRAAAYAKALRQNGKTIKEICEMLTNGNFKTAKGLTNWNPTQIQRLLK